MKLSVEIKDGKFIYEYQIGASQHHATTELSADNLLAFTSLVNCCTSVTNYNLKRWEIDTLVEAKVKEFSKVAK